MLLSDKGRWTKLDPEIDALLCKGWEDSHGQGSSAPYTVNGKDYVADYGAMEQMNVASGFRSQLRRAAYRARRRRHRVSRAWSVRSSVLPWQQCSTTRLLERLINRSLNRSLARLYER